jgi:clan AA aspartic protease (TIGR02281 family)
MFGTESHSFVQAIFAANGHILGKCLAVLAMSLIAATASAQSSTEYRVRQVSTGYLNLHDGPGSGSRTLARIPSGSLLKVLSCKGPATPERNSWCKVEWGAEVGWVSSCCIFAKGEIDDFRNIQRSLAWIGFYAGPIDGEVGPGTRKAIKAFQGAAAQSADGNLTTKEIQSLKVAAEGREQSFHYEIRLDGPTGMRLGLPLLYLPNQARVANGTRYFGSDAKFEVTTFMKTGSLSELYSALKSTKSRNVWYSPLHDDWFVIAGSDPLRGLDFYIRASSNGQEVRGFEARYQPTVSENIGSLITVMSADFDPFPTDSAMVPSKTSFPPLSDIPTSPSRSIRVKMKVDGGTFVVPVKINNAITLDFVVDSGAADVSIPADVVRTLIRTHTITSDDLLGPAEYETAGGTTLKALRFRIESLQVGDKVVENVVGSTAPVKGSLLLGQSFLQKFKSWSIDNANHALVLEPN